VLARLQQAWSFFATVLDFITSSIPGLSLSVTMVGHSPLQVQDDPAVADMLQQLLKKRQACSRRGAGTAATTTSVLAAAATPPVTSAAHAAATVSEQGRALKRPKPLAADSNNKVGSTLAAP
jgi:hypothetical protein